MKITATLMVICMACVSAQGQRHVEVGLSTGITNYYGDLGNVDSPMQWSSTRPGMMITFRDFLNNPKRYVTRSLTTEARISWFRTGYDERSQIKGMEVGELRNYKRGLSFRNDLIGASGHLVLNAYREPYQPLFQQKFFMFFHLGVGVYYGKPKADLFRGGVDINNRYYWWADGTVRDAPRGSATSNVIQRDGKYETDLYSWQTEGGNGAGEASRRSKVSPWHIGVPIGAGVRYMLSKNMSLGVEFTYLMFTDDMVDDVSDKYATYAEIDEAYPGDPGKQELARYISDPTGWGTDGYVSERTSRRGNPGLLDNFSYMGFELSYKFKRRPARRSYAKM